MNVAEQVEIALGNYEGIEPGPVPEAAEPEAAGLVIPNPVGYALGWVLASEIVRNRYRDSAIDVLPVNHPENGWDRFLVTRRVSCRARASEPADSFGVIHLTGEDAPFFVPRRGSVLPLGAMVREHPKRAARRLIERLPEVGLVESDHQACWHMRAEKYPDIYGAVAEIIVEHPGVIAMREIFVDEEQFEGAFHPLYLMTGAMTKGLTYNWFAIESPDYAAFFMVDGSMSVYQTDAGGWATVGRQLREEDAAGIKRRILSWLRIEGKPDRSTID